MNDQLIILTDVVIATVLGGVVGIEREWKKKPAGLRTNMIIAGASALVVSLGRIIVIDFSQLSSEDEMGIDPTRIIHAVVLGVGFIGAGTILKNTQSTSIRYLTTAASIWMSAALGIAVALKQYYLAVGTTVLMLIVNFLLSYLSQAISGRKESKE